MITTSYSWAFDAGGDDVEVFATALRWAFANADADEPHALIVVTSNNQLSNVAGYVGTHARDFEVRGVTLHVRTLKELPVRPVRMPAIALWIVDKQLPKVEALQPTVLCSIPWVLTDNEKWRAARRPIDLLTGDEPEPVTIDRPIVAAAMHWLEYRDGATRPEDRSFAVRVFQRLEAAREFWKPADVRAWIIAHGWSAKDADELEYIAQATLDGKRLKAAHCSPLSPSTVDQWRIEAEQLVQTTE